MRPGRDYHLNASPRARLALWWAPLDVPEATLSRLTSCLSPEEAKRGERFVRPLDRERFAARRGWLRHLLARELLCAPGEVPIVAAPGGKPHLAGLGLRFSLSHSSGMALYALSWEMEVGVDLEEIREASEFEGIAARLFSRAERTAIASLDPPRRLEASFQCWASKEAYVKGLGTGITFPLDTLDVYGGDREYTTVSGWSVQQIDVAPGFAAAVAAENLSAWVPRVPRRLALTD